MGKGKAWTDEETAFLRQYYPYMGAVYVGSELGRTLAAVKARASKVDVRLMSHGRCLTIDDMPRKTVDYGGIEVTWTRGEWRRLSQVLANRADNIKEGRRHL